jgi:hypothetical protein
MQVGEGTEKLFEKVQPQFSTFDEHYKLTGPRNSTNPKHKI